MGFIPKSHSPSPPYIRACYHEPPSEGSDDVTAMDSSLSRPVGLTETREEAQPPLTGLPHLDKKKIAGVRTDNS